MKEQPIFKVVRIGYDNILTSSVQRHPQIIYIPKVWIEPRIGKIFVFKTLVDARAFIRKFLVYIEGTFQIWKSIGKNVTKIDFISCYYHVADFWNGHVPNKRFPKMFRTSPPNGTLVVDEIKLIEKVT